MPRGTSLRVWWCESFDPASVSRADKFSSKLRKKTVPGLKPGCYKAATTLARLLAFLWRSLRGDGKSRGRLAALRLALLRRLRLSPNCARAASASRPGWGIRARARRPRPCRCRSLGRGAVAGGLRVPEPLPDDEWRWAGLRGRRPLQRRAGPRGLRAVRLLFSARG